MEKRTECFIMTPPCYDIKCDICGGVNITWSEYDRMIWCYDCEKDTRGTGGIFDGPIPIEAAQMLGVCFDKIDIATGDRLYLTTKKDGGIEWERKIK